jgi:3-hydroxybutyryl-CoA dehydratase
MNSVLTAPRNNEISRTEATSSQRVYKIGDKAEMTKIFHDEDVINYVRATGDSNPIHCNDEHTANRFKGRIVHGMLVGGVISSVIGTKMPGHGTICVAQN